MVYFIEADIVAMQRTKRPSHSRVPCSVTPTARAHAIRGRCSGAYQRVGEVIHIESATSRTTAQTRNNAIALYALHALRLSTPIPCRTIAEYSTGGLVAATKPCIVHLR